MHTGVIILRLSGWYGQCLSKSYLTRAFPVRISGAHSAIYPRSSLLLSFLSFFLFKQKVAGILSTHIALHPYPHILSVCAYSSVTNAVGPLSLGSLVYYPSYGALRGLPATRQTANPRGWPPCSSPASPTHPASHLMLISAVVSWTIRCTRTVCDPCLYSLHATASHHVCMLF